MPILDFFQFCLFGKNEKKDTQRSDKEMLSRFVIIFMIETNNYDRHRWNAQCCAYMRTPSYFQKHRYTQKIIKEKKNI